MVKKSKRDKWAEEQGQLGKAMDEMKAFITERREGRILDDEERKRVFSPLTTPISKLLRDSLFVSKKDAITGQVVQVPIFDNFLYKKEIDPDTGKEVNVPNFSMDELKTALEGVNDKNTAIQTILQEQNDRNLLIYQELLEMNDRIGNLNIPPIVIPAPVVNNNAPVLEQISDILQRNLLTAQSMDQTLNNIETEIQQLKNINDQQSQNTISKLEELKQEIMTQGNVMTDVIKNINTITNDPLKNPIFDIPYPDLTNQFDDRYTQEDLEKMIEKYHTILLKTHNESYKGLKGVRTYTSDSDLFKLLDNKTQGTMKGRVALTKEEKEFIDEFTSEADGNQKLWQVSFQRLPRNKLFEKKLGDLDNLTVSEVEKILQPSFLQNLTNPNYMKATSSSEKKSSKKSHDASASGKPPSGVSSSKSSPPPAPPPSPSGSGSKRRGHIGQGYGLEVHGYKMKPDGSFGNLKIDFPKLVMYHKLVVSNAQGQNVINEKSDPNLVELLTKRYYKNKNYSELSKQQFKKLVEMSDLPIDPLTNKMELIRGEGQMKSSGVKVFLSENQLIDQLEKIIGSINAGNTSDAMENEGREIILQLYKIGKMTKDDYRSLYNIYFKI